MTTFGLETDVVDAAARDRAVERFRAAGIALPTFAQLADPALAPQSVRSRLAGVGADDADPANLFRVHWFNAADRRSEVEVPGHLVIPPSLSGVECTIVLILGNRFPMIGAHKVQAAYACLAPRVVTGQLDPTVHRAIWPSTGNYARGGVAISRLMGCRGVAVLPENMSRERFEWLEQWVSDRADIIRTPGSESNVKEIYDVCAELARDPQNIVLNQFCEFGNHLAHRSATARAIDVVCAAHPRGRLRAFVSASGSAGTLGAGDTLKEQWGSLTVAVEALECPTLLRNGFGEHNIQGIGDKHVPYIHNVMATDVVTAVSDESTDALDVLFNTDAGRRELARQGVPDGVIGGLPNLGLSSICNLVASIKVAKRLGLGSNDLIATVATDGSAMYGSERAKTMARRWPDGFDERAAAAVFAEHLGAITDDHLLECATEDRNRIFNLGYFTWVEQQGVSLDDFEARRSPAFWDDLLDRVPRWDAAIEEFNERTGVLASW
ncbi:MAG TPA: pyridoxal-phosphate dependent enzyme [Acidimicrobiales bacterium]|nr:pyridoxal-phosphate dependent enzyme [Acidimicrobiales bacterium]